MADIIQIRRGTSSLWASVNPILADGELGYETDTRKEKIGDGVRFWNDLLYKNIITSDSLYLGFFQTSAELNTAYPAAVSGNYAVIGDTDTVWIWDADTAAWVDTLNPQGLIPLNSVGVAELNGELKATIDLGTSNEVDWMDGVQFKKTLTATTVITHAKLVENKTTFLRLTGAQAFSIQHVVEIGGIADYDGALINVIQMHCSDATPGSEKITANWFNKF